MNIYLKYYQFLDVLKIFFFLNLLLFPLLLLELHVKHKFSHFLNKLTQESFCYLTLFSEE